MNVHAHTVYTGRSTNWPTIVLTTALVVPLLVMAVTGDGSWTAVGLLIPLGVVVAAVVVNLLTATSVRATAGPSGVTVNLGVFGWPRFRYPLERIQHAEAITIPASQWAWGLFWSPRKGLMLTLRTGPALRLVADQRPQGHHQHAASRSRRRRDSRRSRVVRASSRSRRHRSAAGRRRAAPSGRARRQTPDARPVDPDGRDSPRAEFTRRDPH